MRLDMALTSAVLLALGVLGGSITDDYPDDPPCERGGFLVLEADFHTHTRFSDGFLSPFDVVVQARRRGLDVVAITEHNIVFPSIMARWFSEQVGGPTVLTGSEISTPGYHLHGIGIEEEIHWGLGLRAAIDEIHRQGGVAIAAHPVRHVWEVYDEVRDVLDGSEVMHPSSFNRGSSRGWRWEDMLTFYLRAQREGYDIAAIGSSDYHAFSILGICRTYVFAESDRASDVLDAIRAGRTVVFDRMGGTAYGDEALIALLEADPLPATDYDYGYKGNGALDVIARSIGWLGLMGLVLFRPNRSQS
jgi:predicted metal-dependent phosphoesterase TrpH